jgi:cell division protein FtsW
VFVLLVLTPIIGTEIKGAKRWINMAGMSIQPSEFMKPALIVLTAWMISARKKNPQVPGYTFAFGFYAVAVGLLLLQPDMGMVILMSTIFFFQFFLAGLPLLWIVLVSLLGGVSFVSAYFLFPHVHERIDRFLSPDTTSKFNERYQITQSLDAFAHGGLWGQGPGEGVVKKHLPDAHADFIFSVAGEEYGFILCVLIVILFAIIVLRSISRVFHRSDRRGGNLQPPAGRW